MSEFAHLHCHTEYSFQDGVCRIRDICAKAEALGMKACAITDHGNMCGALPFYLECRKRSINPIIGMEAYICQDHEKSPKEERSHLILLAENNEGYKNLLALSSASYNPAYFYKKPRIDWTLLRTHSNGLIALSGCLSGEIPQAILSENMDKARETARAFKNLFPDRFFLEVQQNGLPDQEKVNTALQELSESEKIPLVATNDCHYLDKSDSILNDVAICIQFNEKLGDPERFRLNTRELYFKSQERMRRDFLDIPGAFENACGIARRCNVEIQTNKSFFPVFCLPEGVSEEKRLEKLAMDGLAKKGLASDEAYAKRLKQELQTITEMGYSGYFLIVQDYVGFAKSQGIPVGPGRGSAAGSLVAWCLGITEIDPVKYGLFFERFLNPERVSLPDIDIDICKNRRKEVINYIRGKYGVDHVAHISAFNKFEKRGVVKDVGRIMEMSYPDTDRLAKMIPEKTDASLQKILTNGPLASVCEKDPQAREVIGLAIRLEDTVRHAGIHAAGIVISDRPLSERVPTWLMNEEFATQYDGPMAEKAGLLKFDLLGLSTLTIIQNTLWNIGRSGKQVPDLQGLPLDDQEIYALLSRGETRGVFQVEGEGLTKYMIRLKPACFDDLVAMLALYRPGPLESGMVDSFIRRSHGEEEIVYPHESLEGCLKETYGVIVYQEQVMEIAKIIAGYSLGQADILRRAMGKKKAEEMAAERANFVRGAEERGIEKEKANEIFNLMDKFAQYGFNKSHSAAYALLSYRTAWLKVHHPCEFMAALLTKAANNDDKKLLYAEECARMGISLLPPNLNLSDADFVPENKCIRWGLSGIKDFGESSIREILKNRKDGYKSLADLCSRVSKKKVNEALIKALIQSGACDCLGKSRKAMIAHLKEVRDSKEILDFDDCKEYPKKELLKREKESLGIYLSAHPLEELPQMEGCVTLEECAGLPGISSVVALVTKIKKISTKDGKMMAFATIQDRTSVADLVIWPDKYEAVISAFKKNGVLKITVEPNNRKKDERPGIQLVCVDAERID